MYAIQRREPEATDDAQPVAFDAALAANADAMRLLYEIDLHSEPVREVLGVPPQWLVRWGSSIVLGVVVALGMLSWVVQYPDVIPAPIVLTSANPPASVVAPSGGQLVDVRVHDNDHVDRGTVLAIIASSADPAAVLRLEERLAALGPDLDRPAQTLDFAENLPLGEVQADYSTFVKNYRTLRYYFDQDPIGQQIRSLEPQLGHQRERLQDYRRQQEILGEEANVAERDYERSRELASRRNMSLETVDEREQQLLQTRRDLEGVRLDITGIRLDIDRLEQTRVELRTRDEDQRHRLALALAESLKNLRSRLAIWDHSHVLRAPISGRVSLFRFWSDHQVVKAGEEVLTVVRDGPLLPIGRVALPLTNSGKVKPGQTVFIQLDDYPFQEYGLLKGVVSTVAPVPREARYAVEVALPQALMTTFGRRLEFRQEMQGQAEIVTEDLRLLERIFYPLRSLFIGDSGRRASSPR